MIQSDCCFSTVCCVCDIVTINSPNVGPCNQIRIPYNCHISEIRRWVTQPTQIYTHSVRQPRKVGRKKNGSLLDLNCKISPQIY